MAVQRFSAPSFFRKARPGTQARRLGDNRPSEGSEEPVQALLRLGIVDFEDFVELALQLSVIRRLEIAFGCDLGDLVEALASERIELCLAEPQLVAPEEPAEEALGVRPLEEGQVARQSR